MTSNQLARIPKPAGSPHATRWELLRDVAVFQGKLLLDGFRDLALSPVSLVAALVDLLLGGQRFGHRFYAVVLAGRRLEGWINLFGAADRLEPRADLSGKPEARSVDSLVGRLETVLVEQYRRGGVTTSAKDAIDRALDLVSRRPRS